MGARSRKRRRPGAAGGAAEAGGAAGGGRDTAPVAQSADAGRADRGNRAASAAAADRAARSERRDAAVRAQLRPLAEGERPPALVVAALLAAGLALANLALWLAGTEVQGRPSGFGAVLFAAIMLVAAVGMWRRQYWAVLGFQALLGVSLVIAGLSLAVAANWQGVALALLVLVVGGTLFWKLVRTMARLQIPERPGEERR